MKHGVSIPEAHADTYLSGPAALRIPGAPNYWRLEMAHSTASKGDRARPASYEVTIRCT